MNAQLTPEETEKLKLKWLADQEKKVMEYTLDTGSLIKLSVDIVKHHVCKNPLLTNPECMRIMQVCKLRKLNPFTDIDVVKYYADMDAQIIVKKDFFVERANKVPTFKGFKAGIVVLNKEGEMIDREGCIKFPDEQLIGGWCISYDKNKEIPSLQRPPLEEYLGKTKKGEVNSQWKKMPATMIRKVAVKQSLAELYPDQFRGLADDAELLTITGITENKNGNGDIKEANKKELNNLLTKKDGTVIDTLSGEITKEKEPVEAKQTPDKTQDALKQNNMFDEKHAEEQGFALMNDKEK